MREKTLAMVNVLPMLNMAKMLLSYVASNTITAAFVKASYYYETLPQEAALCITYHLSVPCQPLTRQET